MSACWQILCRRQQRYIVRELCPFILADLSDSTRHACYMDVNAPMESAHGTVKVECVYAEHYTTREPRPVVYHGVPRVLKY